MIKVIKYETNKQDRLLTKCPQRKKFGQDIINVGSTICTQCVNFVFINNEYKIVVCNDFK